CIVAAGESSFFSRIRRELFMLQLASQDTSFLESEDYLPESTLSSIQEETENVIMRGIAACDGQDLYRQYCAELDGFPPLNKERERALMHRLELVRCGLASQAEGEQIAHSLIEGSLRLVIY